MQVVKAADGDDTDSDFDDPEITSPSSLVTYQVILDNDSSVPVTVASLSDDIYDPVTCEDSSGLDIVGQTLAADDGDGNTRPDGGDDEAVCTFIETAPAEESAVVTDNVLIGFTDSGTNYASDSATIMTPPLLPVGGVVELQVTSERGPESASPDSGSTGRDYELPAAAIAAGALVAATITCYAWRRSLR